MMTTQGASGGAGSARTEGDRVRRADLMAAAAGITIGVREYHADTGEYTTVREPERLAGEGPLPAYSRAPWCDCPQAPACRDREAGAAQ